MITEQDVHNCGLIQLDHPVCNHDLTPGDNYLLQNLKSHLIVSTGQKTKDSTQVNDESLTGRRHRSSILMAFCRKVLTPHQGGHKVGEKIPRVFQAFPEP